MDEEFTDAEIERLDFLRNTTADFINSLVGREIEDDPDLIDRIVETVWDGVKDKGLGITEMEFYPYREH